MTGSMRTGPAKPRNDPSPRLGRKMTLTPPSGQPIQLTPLWEHVVRTRRFPLEIDTRLTFLEIAERLRDPEWEVRQHALRVLVDVLPTLNADVIGKVMQPVVPELINNLGHPAPAVRKGALDTLRVYLVHSHDREETVKKILQDGLNRSEGRDPFQTNVTTGVILSAPSLLFPSSGSPTPAVQLVKDTTIALASRLAQVAHQEAVLKSLIKIREAVGTEEFDRYIDGYDDRLRRNIEILAKIYNIKPRRRSGRRVRGNAKDDRKDEEKGRTWDSDSDTSGIVEEEDEIGSGGTMPPGRVVLETEIKFNEETAITMTILEEKGEDSENEQEDDESGTDVRNDVEIVDLSKDVQEDRRKTPRRVHFGGEVVKLRTPDSDETESVELMQKTKIPVPVSPATKMPERPRRRPSSQPCSPSRERLRSRRESRSVSSSPKREIYTHNAELSPKKSILTRTISPIFVAKPVEALPVAKRTRRKKTSNREEKGRNEVGGSKENCLNSSEVLQIVEKLSKSEEVKSLESRQNSALNTLGDLRTGTKDASLNDKLNEDKKLTPSLPDNKNRPSRREEEYSSENSLVPKTDEKSSTKDSQKISSLQGKGNAFETFPKQERNYILMELCSPERRAHKNENTGQEVKASKENTVASRESKNVDGKFVVPGSVSAEDSPSRETNMKRIDSPFGSVIEEIDSDQELFTKAEHEEIRRSLDDRSNRDGEQAEDPETLSKFEEEVDEASATIKKDFVGTVNDSVTVNPKEENVGGGSSRTGESEEAAKSEDYKRSASATEKSVDRSIDEVESRSGEPSWEELGLVNQEVLDDLHNKDDWRARVRGLERVASALRASSALIAIEQRLGSLLHAVLGCERSCRVAAAGLAVARVAVAGVSADALRRRLPQLAWGLARQGGASSAQLARIAMLRLRPALLLDQLLQPQCLAARNAKTRENALQLLIFSLVTFPSTEFKVDTVANKVAKMVGDRRRRVRQAALDTLAVLAQVYDPEEVLAAGKRAATGRHDGESMISAIRARLARKSLPLVSADGLVVYGLQISPTVQIATGPDVDWIVAGSGSVSPGTGRTRGQIITTSKCERGRNPRAGSTKTRENPWTERPNLIALGVGLRPEVEQPLAWQIVPNETQDEIQCEDQLNEHEDRETEVRDDLRSSEQSRISVGPTNYRSVAASDLDQRRSYSVEGSVKEKESATKAESRIPILSSRERVAKPSARMQDKSTSFELTSSRRRTKDFGETVAGQINAREENDSVAYGSLYQRRKRFQPENTGRISATTQLSKQSFDSHYNSYRPTSRGTRAADSNKTFYDVAENTSEEFSDVTSKSYQKFLERDKFLRKSDVRSRGSRANSSDSQQLLARNIQRQTPLSHELSFPRRDVRFMDQSSSFRALQTAPTPLTRIYHEDDDFAPQRGEISGRVASSRARLYCRTKDATSQKPNGFDSTSSDAQTNVLDEDGPYRRRLRSLSPSQLYRRRQSVRLAPDEFHAVSMYDIDKAVNEEEYNERNKHHFLPETDAYHVQNINAAEPRFDEGRGRVLSKSGSSSSSDVSRINRQPSSGRNEIEGRDYSDSGSTTPRSRDAEAAFDVITNNPGSPIQVSAVDSFVIPLTQKLEAATETINTSLEDDTSKDWSSEEDIKLRSRSQAPSRSSNRSEIVLEVNPNEGESTFEENVERRSARRRSVVSILSNERMQITEILQTSNESLHSSYSKEFHDVHISPSTKFGSPKKSEASSQSPSRKSENFEASRSSSRRNSRSSPLRLSFEHLNEEPRDSSEERIISSILQDDDVPFQRLDAVENDAEESPAIIIASRPHSNEATVLRTESKSEAAAAFDDVDDAQAFAGGVNDTIDERQSKDSTTETNMEPGILKIESHPMDAVSLPKRMPSKVPRGTGRPRANSNKGNPEKTTEKSKPIVQQCFAQLENKDWEITMKGLKALSQIAKQHPEYLDVCATGTIGRLLGRHVKNLRSQVARTACAAAADVFGSQIRGIDQDIDDIAGPLLHRTADTNRFLRADSNAALDKMIEHLPPHKTIGIIVHRGASHQNAIVRAATARLLASLVEKLGGEHSMTLPRDVREKLLNAGAKLLMDGNLDARNHAKKLFRNLTRCEGFRRALSDAVPETTLRHIDKTLKTL